jgi:hypothetical protein
MVTEELCETTGLERCSFCGTEPRNRDKFCRHCGTPRIGVVTARLDAPEFRVRPWSGPILNSVTRGLSGSGFLHSRGAKRVASALIALPLWLLIILLSPIDACIAASSLAKQG